MVGYATAVLDQHPKARLGTYLNAIAIRIVNIESFLTIVSGLDGGGAYAFTLHVRMSGVNIVYLKGGMVRRGRWGVGILNDVYHGAAGQLQPVQVLTIDHFGNPSQAQDILVPLQRCFFVLDVVGNVIDIFESNMIR
jgi:hypothetical protein